jgi:hypothetical protein
MSAAISTPPVRNLPEFTRLINHSHQESGRTLVEVADLCTIDSSYISHILHGRRRPGRNVLLRLCLQGWDLDFYTIEEILKAGGYQTLADWPKSGWDE